MNILGILEGIISSVPEAIQLYHKVAPMITTRADITDGEIAAVNELVPTAHAIVQSAHEAIDKIIDAHATT